MTPKSRARLQIVAASVLFATGGPAIKACAMGGWQVACFRAAIAAVTLALLVPGARAGLSWRAALVGLFHGTTMVLYVVANKLTTSANTIFLQESALFYILLLGPWLLHEKLARHDALVILLVVIGLLLFFTGSEDASATAPHPARGNVLAAISGVTWAFTVIGLRWLGSRASSGQASDQASVEGGAIAAVLCGNTFAALVSLPMALPVEHAGALDVTVLIYLGVLQIALAYVFVARGIRHVTALEASLLFLIEPVLNPLLAWLIHGETPHRNAIAGGVLILCATALKAWRDRGEEAGARARATREADGGTGGGGELRAPHSS